MVGSILLVDSDRDTREMYAEFLRATACTVATAASADEALIRLAADKLDLIISEIALPGTDGIALCRRVRADAARRRLPILIVTAMAHPHYTARAKVAGADRILQKPAAPDVVCEHSMAMIACRHDVSRQVASLHRVAVDVAARIASAPGRAVGSGWEQDALATDAGTAIGAVLTDRSGVHLGVNRTATELTGFSRREMIAQSIWDLLPPARRQEGRAVWRWFQDTGRLHGSVTIQPKHGGTRELHYLALGDVVPGAHLSVFVPHPFELASSTVRLSLG